MNPRAGRSGRGMKGRGRQGRLGRGGRYGWFRPVSERGVEGDHGVPNRSLLEKKDNTKLMEIVDASDDFGEDRYVQSTYSKEQSNTKKILSQNYSDGKSQSTAHSNLNKSRMSNPNTMQSLDGDVGVAIKQELIESTSNNNMSGMQNVNNFSTTNEMNTLDTVDMEVETNNDIEKVEGTMQEDGDVIMLADSDDTSELRGEPIYVQQEVEGSESNDVSTSQLQVLWSAHGDAITQQLRTEAASEVPKRNSSLMARANKRIAENETVATANENQVQKSIIGEESQKDELSNPNSPKKKYKSNENNYSNKDSIQGSEVRMEKAPTNEENTMVRGDSPLKSIKIPKPPINTLHNYYRQNSNTSTVNENQQSENPTTKKDGNLSNKMNHDESVGDSIQSNANQTNYESTHHDGNENANDANRAEANSSTNGLKSKKEGKLEREEDKKQGEDAEKGMNTQGQHHSNEGKDGEHDTIKQNQGNQVKDVTSKENVSSTSQPEASKAPKDSEDPEEDPQQGEASNGVMKSYGRPKEEKTPIKYYDPRVKKDVVFITILHHECEGTDKDAWKETFWNFKILYGILMNQKTVLVPVNEDGDNKAPLQGIPREATSVRHESLSDYASVRNPWIGFRQPKDRVKFAVKVHMEQRRNAWQFGKAVQESLQTRTKNAENGFHFVRVSEYNQIRIASIIGCGPTTHLGDLKAAIIQEMKKRSDKEVYYPIDLKNDVLSCNLNGSRLEAPVVSITAGRSIAEKAVVMIKEISDDADAKLHEGKDFAIFDRNITVFLDYHQENQEAIAPLLELQIKHFKRCKAVKYRGIYNLNKEITLKTGESMLLRKAILKIPTDNTTEAVPLFCQVDRSMTDGTSSTKNQPSRTSEITLTCDVSHLEIARTKTSQLRDELKKLLTEDSFKETFPPPPQRRVMENAFKDQTSAITSGNMSSNIARMQKMMDNRVSSAIVVSGSTRSLPQNRKRHQSVWELRKQVSQSIWTDKILDDNDNNASNANEVQSQSQMRGSEGSSSYAAITAAPASSHQNTTQDEGSPETALVPKETQIVATEQPAPSSLVMPNGMTFSDFLNNLEAQSLATTKSLEATKIAMKEDRRKTEEWQKIQEENNMKIGQHLQTGIQNTALLSAKVNEGISHTNALKEQMNDMTKQLDMVTNFIMKQTGPQERNEPSTAHPSGLITQSLTPIDFNSQPQKLEESQHQSLEKAVPPSDAAGTGQS